MQTSVTNSHTMHKSMYAALLVDDDAGILLRLLMMMMNMMMMTTTTMCNAYKMNQLLKTFHKLIIG